jgi:hypothetical protein
MPPAELVLSFPSLPLFGDGATYRAEGVKGFPVDVS